MHGESVEPKKAGHLPNAVRLVIDGQQRLTTLLIFIATALREVAEIEGRDFLTSHYIEHPEFEQKFKIVQESSSIVFDNFSDGINFLKNLRNGISTM